MIAKRHVGSSYHIAVVTDDALQGVTHVVRGKDIEPATPLHMLLQRLLGLPTPHYLHHELILRREGREAVEEPRAAPRFATSARQGVTAGDIRRRLGFD